MNQDFLNCYKAGCGQKFDPLSNDKDECCHHPGVPYFHDAYKGWTCCQKKSTDFTEFLNIKGCTLGKHSGEKPPEAPKPNSKLIEDVDVIVRKPVKPSALKRPPFDSPLDTLRPTIAESLKQQLIKSENPNQTAPTGDEAVELGTKCKNGGCMVFYEGPESNNSTCLYHPGVPIFHEGMKYWSCCKKKTTCFDVFINQAGCTSGCHKWKKEVEAAGTIKCRWDWHQTSSHVVVSVYAKQYHPEKSYIKLNPIRMIVHIVFPSQANSAFSLDVELRGIIDVSESGVNMTSSKVEISLRKAEAGVWSNLDFPSQKVDVIETPKPSEDSESSDEDVDLSSVEALSKIGAVQINEVSS